jgi:hypothetical protein
LPCSRNERRQRDAELPSQVAPRAGSALRRKELVPRSVDPDRGTRRAEQLADGGTESIERPLRVAACLAGSIDGVELASKIGLQFAGRENLLGVLVAHSDVENSFHLHDEFNDVESHGIIVEASTSEFNSVVPRRNIHRRTTPKEERGLSPFRLENERFRRRW